jgi:hypothetical protein
VQPLGPASPRYQDLGRGKDADSPDVITCTSAISETDETGTFEGTFTVTAVPAG